MKMKRIHLLTAGIFSCLKEAAMETQRKSISVEEFEEVIRRTAEYIQMNDSLIGCSFVPAIEQPNNKLFYFIFIEGVYEERLISIDIKEKEVRVLYPKYFKERILKRYHKIKSKQTSEKNTTIVLNFPKELHEKLTELVVA